MSFKSTISKFIIFTVVLFSVFYIFNFVTDKKDALANINNKQIVEVFKTPSCGCCYGYVLFLEEEKFQVKQTDMRSLHTIKQKYNIESKLILNTNIIFKKDTHETVTNNLRQMNQSNLNVAEGAQNML